MANQLVALRANGLFGHLNHELDFSSSTGITILHGPNGTGKSTLLRIVNEVSLHLPATLLTVPCRSIEFEFTNGQTLTIRPVDDELRYTLKSGRTTRFRWSLSRDVFVDNLYSIARAIRDDYGGRRITMMMRRNNEKLMFDYAAALVRGTSDAAFEYREYLKQGDFVDTPDWLVELWADTRAHLIEDQRLVRTVLPLVGSDEDEGRRVVTEFADELSEKIWLVLAQYGEVSQQLDRTFPTRVIAALAGSRRPRAKRLLRELEEIETRRTALREAGLLEESAASVGFEESELDRRDIRSVLDVYIKDTRKKLKVFDELLAKITLLEQLLAEHFRTIRLDASKQEGFALQSIGRSRKPLDPSLLSSGEQHLLVLFYTLLFRSPGRDSFVMIDEPEISLHPAWQLKFVSSLERILANTGGRVVLATHSPQILGQHWREAQALTLSPGE